MRASRILLLFAAACGSSAPAPTPQATSVTAPAPLDAPPAGPDDRQVASVNGRPVYASCLESQARRGATRQEALEQCVDFELLAQAATRHASDADVALATRTAMVSLLVAREYEARFTRPSEFGAYWERSLARNRGRFDHGEVRGSAYVRIPVPRTAPPAQEASARALAEELAAALATERGLLPVQFEQLARQRIAGRGTLEYAAVGPYENTGGLVPEYAGPLFAIAEVGMTSPAVRTPWGWDVILFSEVIPAERMSPDEVIARALPEIKRAYFPIWVSQATSSMAGKVKVHEENLPRLEDL